MAYYCPRCKRNWKTVVMVDIERGSWSGLNRIQCPECRLIDYPDNKDPRRYGPPIPVN